MSKVWIEYNEGFKREKWHLNFFCGERCRVKKRVSRALPPGRPSVKRGSEEKEFKTKMCSEHWWGYRVAVRDKKDSYDMELGKYISRIMVNPAL